MGHAGELRHGLAPQSKICRHIEAWRNREITGEFPYLYLDGVILKRSWAGEVRNISVLVAMGIGTDGYRQILGVAEGEKEDLEGWRGFTLQGRYMDAGVCVVRGVRSKDSGKSSVREPGSGCRGGAGPAGAGRAIRVPGVASIAARAARHP